MNGGSLLNLLESVGALPESILLEIARVIADTINFLHNEAKMSHNGLTMSQVLFDKNGKIKLNLDVMHYIMNDDGSYNTSLGPSKLSVYYRNQINSPTRKKKIKMFNSDHDNETKNEVFAQDVFDLGYILLIAATGGLDLINQEVLDFNGAQDYPGSLLQWSEKVESNGGIKISDLLDRYSPEFNDFLNK